MKQETEITGRFREGTGDGHGLCQGQCPSVRPASPENRPTFREAREIAEQQIGMAYIGAQDKPLARELALIMAEVYASRGGALIRIGSELIEAEMVAEIFCELTQEHVERVIDKYKRITFGVRNIHGYLRTALYNAVFETEAGTINEVNQAEGV